MNTLELSSSLRRIISVLHKGLRRQITHEKAFSMTELETFGFLARQGSLLPSELAVLTKVKTQSMSQILKRFDEENMIVRTPSEDDKRKVYISLSAAGKKLLENARYSKDEWLKLLIEKNLTESERQLLEQALPILKKLTEFK